jgi:hypothetical protein
MRCLADGTTRPLLGLQVTVYLIVALTSVDSVRASDQRAFFSDRTEQTQLDFTHFNGMSGELYFAEMVGPGVAFFDYDGDGDLDAYLVQGKMLGDDKPIQEATFPLPYPLPLSDRLYRNDLQILPDGARQVRFVDVTDSSEIEAPGYGMGVATGDFNNDGWVDLYLTNFGPNQMLRNNGDGTFTDVTAVSGTNDKRWSVPAIFVDFDRDGWLDLYVGNFVQFRLANHRNCSSALGAFDYCGPSAYEPETDRLFRNRGDGTFEDVSIASGITKEFGSTLGAVGADFNNDGWVDIYVANDGLPNQLWINQHDGTFQDEAVLSGSAVNESGMPEASMGVVAGDFDGDGSVDLFMSHLAEETNTFYLNDGTGLFREATRDSGLGLPSWQYTGFGTALADYDNDGWLDLCVVNGAVHLIEPQLRAGDPHPLNQINQLFRNLGGGKFQGVTAEAGPAFELEEVSRGLASGDVDNDGDADFLIGNNAGPARLLVNEIGQDAAWLGIRVYSRNRHRDVQGARLTVTLEGRSALRRRLGSDGSYASANDPRITIGLNEGGGESTVRVLWPGGGLQEWRALPEGKYITLTEGLHRLVQ